MNSCVCQLLLIWIPNIAENICRMVGKKFRRSALNAFIIHCGTKLVRIAPLNTLTDSISVFAESQTVSHFCDSDTQMQTIYFYITEVYLALIHWWVVYAIFLLFWKSACFIILSSYTHQFYITELHSILEHCWGIPYLITLQGNSQSQWIAEVYPNLNQCWVIPHLNTLHINSQIYSIAEPYPIQKHCWGIPYLTTMLGNF